MTFATAKVNDYICFESLTDAFGVPSGTIANPGDKVYYRITKKFSPTSIFAIRGNNLLSLKDKYLENDIYIVKAQFPYILQDWKLRVSLPTKLPLKYALIRWFLNLRKK